MTKLFRKTNDTVWRTSGEVFFQIPNEKWLVDHGWIQKGDKGPFYLKQFEIFLPPHQIEIGTPFRVETQITVIKDFVNGKEYEFDQPVKFHLKYDENNVLPQPCTEQIEPYSTCWNNRRFPICIKKPGLTQGPFYPTTGALWKIQVRSKYELPTIHHTTPFFLKARIQLCSKGSDERRQKRNLDSNNIPGCCKPNQYYDIKAQIEASYQSPCKTCPSGAVPKMGGYFCEKCP